MSISNDTRYIEVALILENITAECLKELQVKAPIAVFGNGGYYAMTLGQFGALLQGVSPAEVLGVTGMESMTVFEYYTLQGLPDFIKTYIERLQRLTPELTADERIGSAMCLPVTAAEGLLLYAREYFGLHSFAEAESIRLSDILIAKKDSYNALMRQRAQVAKMKENSKRKRL